MCVCVCVCVCVILVRDTTVVVPAEAVLSARWVQSDLQNILSNPGFGRSEHVERRRGCGEFRSFLNPRVDVSEFQLLIIWEFGVFQPLQLFSWHAGASSWFSVFGWVISCIILFLSSCVIFALHFPSLFSSRWFSVHTCVSLVNQFQVSSLIVFSFLSVSLSFFPSWCWLVGASCACIWSSRVLFSPSSARFFFACILIIGFQVFLVNLAFLFLDLPVVFLLINTSSRDEAPLAFVW